MEKLVGIKDIVNKSFISDLNLQNKAETCDLIHSRMCKVRQSM